MVLTSKIRDCLNADIKNNSSACCPYRLRSWIILVICVVCQLLSVVNSSENDIKSLSCYFINPNQGSCRIEYFNGDTVYESASDVFKARVVKKRENTLAEVPDVDQIAKLHVATLVDNSAESVREPSQTFLNPNSVFISNIDTSKVTDNNFVDVGVDYPDDTSREVGSDSQTTSCNLKSMGGTNYVCVCNKDYCDDFPPIPPVPEDKFLWYTTTRDGLRFAKTTGDFATDIDPSAEKFSINTTKKYQKIFGFGGAFTDSTGINIKSLSEEVQKSLMNSYFGPNGIQYTMGRVPIAGTDFSVREYSYMDDPNNPSIVSFKLAEEDYKYKIPIIQTAIELAGGLKLIASAWSAPKWMKNECNITGSSSLKSEYYSLWTDYYLRFLDEYNKENISFWALTTGNEPMNEFYLTKPPFFNRMGWSPCSLSKWVSSNLGPKLSESPYKDLLLLLFDENRDLLPYYVQWFFENCNKKNSNRGSNCTNIDDDVYKFIHGIAVHWYFDSDRNLPFLQWMKDLYPDKFLIYTESCVVPFAGLGNWESAAHYATEIIENFNHHVTAWVDWNLALDINGGPNWVGNIVNAPIMVNASADEFYKDPIFYILGHFSKFIDPDSIRVETAPYKASGIWAVTVQRPDNSIVIVFYNENEHDQDVVFTIDDERNVFLTAISKSLSSVIVS